MVTMRPSARIGGLPNRTSCESNRRGPATYVAAGGNVHQGRSFSSSCSVPGAGLCAAAALLVGTSSLGAKQAEPTPAQVALHVLKQDIRVAELLRSLQEVAP